MRKFILLLFFIVSNFLNAVNSESSNFLPVHNRRTLQNKPRLPTSLTFRSWDHLDSNTLNLLLHDYLLPASEKVSISDWLNPSEQDYHVLQQYLSCARRPELVLLNYPNTHWRSERIREMKLITSHQKPVFEILKINSSSAKEKTCIVTYVSCNDSYSRSLERFIESLKKSDFQGDLIYRLGGWPNTAEGSLEFFDVPYAFKIFAIQEAKRLGYSKVLWIDVSFILQKLQLLFDHLENKGLLFFAYPSYNPKFHIQEFAANAFGSSEKEFNRMTYIQAFVLGFNFENPIALDLLESWAACLKNKIGFLSFIPEQAPLTILINKKGLLPFQGDSRWIRSVSHPDANACLIWDRDCDLASIAVPKS